MKNWGGTSNKNQRARYFGSLVILLVPVLLCCSCVQHLLERDLSTTLPSSYSEFKLGRAGLSATRPFVVRMPSWVDVDISKNLLQLQSGGVVRVGMSDADSDPVVGADSVLVKGGGFHGTVERELDSDRGVWVESYSLNRSRDHLSIVASWPKDSQKAEGDVLEIVKAIVNSARVQEHQD